MGHFRVAERGTMKADERNTEVQNLILRVREGDQSAFGALVALYDPLVQSEIARHGDGLGDFDREDLRQLAWLALYRAAFSFDLSQSEVSFGLYAKICMANALSTQLRAIRRRTVEVPVAEEWYGEQTHDDSDPAKRVMEEEDLQLLRTRIRALLSPFENRVWNLFTAGYSVKSIAKRLERTPRTIENAVYRIRQKLRAGLDTGDK